MHHTKNKITIRIQRPGPRAGERDAHCAGDLRIPHHVRQREGESELHAACHAHELEVSSTTDYCAGAGVLAFHRSTSEAVVVLSVFLKGGTGSFEWRSRYPSFSARRAFIAAWRVISAS